MSHQSFSAYVLGVTLHCWRSRRARATKHSAQYSFGADSRMTFHGGRLYSAWHSTNTINVFDLVANEPLPPITLEGYDGWILGMAVTDAGELIVSGDTWGDTINVFDVATGAKLRELRPTQPVFGLSCVAGG